MDQSTSHLNIRNDNQNEEHEKHFPELIDNGFNDYSDGLIQPANMIEINNANSTNNEGFLQMSYENTIIGENEQRSNPPLHQVSLPQYSPSRSVHNGHAVGNANNDHIIPTMQYPPLRSVPVQHEQTSQNLPIQQYACTYNDINDQHQNQKQSISNLSSLHEDLNVNLSSTNELFKIEISGIEIIVRRRSDLNQNYSEMQNERNIKPQQDEQSHLALKNQTKRIQSRMHPYRVPIKQNKIINGDHSVIDRCSCCPTMMSQ